MVTGPLSNEEIAIRSSVGYFLFMPPREDQRIIKEVGLELLICEDITDNMARMAKRWGAARASREKDLRNIEGDETFEGQQAFFSVAALIAGERRLSRFIYVATKPE